MAATSVEIIPASAVNRQDLVTAINAAYEAYFVPIILTLYTFEELIKRESILLEQSRVALSSGQVIGMGLLGVRGRRGWIGGMGVVPAWRGQGISRKVLHALIAAARSQNLTSVQLEVIVQNRVALKLYETVGFKTRRTLHVLARDGSLRRGDPPFVFLDNLQIKPSLPENLSDELQRLSAVPLPWQREYAVFSSFRRVKGLAAMQMPFERVAGLCVYSEHGDGADLLALLADSAETGQALLTSLLSIFPRAHLSYLNVPDSDPMLPSLEAAGFEIALSQYEMTFDPSQEPLA